MATETATIRDSETVTDEATDGTRLVRYDDGGGAVLERYDDPDFGEVDSRVEYDHYRDARLHMALWVSADRLDRPDRSALAFVPTQIVALGKPYVAAWLYLNGGNGHPGARSVVAERLGVSEHTVSRYLSDVRGKIGDVEAPT